MEDYQVKARISEELSKELNAFIEDINSVAKDGDRKATISDVIRFSLETYLKDSKLKENANLIKVPFDHKQCLYEDLEEVSDLLGNLFSKYENNRSMHYIYKFFRRVIIQIKCLK